MPDIQSISQGNYILATQQEVSHDNTLSGNGTSASPLGVVPSYNETVLWSGDFTGTGNITLSESVYNFSKVAVFDSSEGVNIDAPTEFVFDVDTTAQRLVVRPNGAVAKSVIAAENGLYFWGNESVVYPALPTTFSVGSTRRWHVSNDFSVIDHSNLNHITKIVGINRK